MESYQYISFSNTPINLAMMAEQSRFQLEPHLPLFEDTIDTFIESFAA